MACCGKMICIGCIHAPVYDNQGNEVVQKACAFCRTPVSSSIDDQELIRQFEKRTELNDSYAIYSMGCYYAQGENGLPQNYAKALELLHRAGDLGCAEAYFNIGYIHNRGIAGVEMNKKKAIHYWELAAMEGHVTARNRLGETEGQAGNMDRALKHWMIAVKDGNLRSLENIKTMYKNGYTTKEDYAKALRSYQAYLDEIKSEHKYYESAV